MYFALKPEHFSGRHRFQPGENVYNMDNLIRQRSKVSLHFSVLLLLVVHRVRAQKGGHHSDPTHGAEDQTPEIS